VQRRLASGTKTVRETTSATRDLYQALTRNRRLQSLERWPHRAHHGLAVIVDDLNTSIVDGRDRRPASLHLCRFAALTLEGSRQSKRVAVATIRELKGLNVGTTITRLPLDRGLSAAAEPPSSLATRQPAR